MSKRLVITFLVLLVALAAPAKKVGGKQLPESIKLGDQTVVLNGAGLRKKLFIKVYAGALYLKAKSKDKAAVLAADEPMLVRMHFIYDGVSAEKLIEAWNEGFENALGSSMASLQSEIDAFNALFTETAKEDDVIDIAYLPGTGVQVSLNGKVLGKVNGGMAFKKAVFAIWLGKNSALKDLGNSMTH